MSKNKEAVELGRKGGKATLKKYGKDHYKKMLEKRWNKEERRKIKKTNEKIIT